MRHSVLIVASAFAAACAFPNHKASKVVELSLPAAAVERLQCESHNGGITVNGDPAATDIGLRAELSVRGFSQEEADANLHLLEVGQETKDGTLRIFGKYPSGELLNRSPSFSFTLKVPQRMAVQLESHNGDIVADGVQGPAKLETHNGDIGGALRTGNLSATTHNGDVTLRIAGDGALDGEVTSHNGDIDLQLAEGLGTSLEASTHNGRVTPPSKLVDASLSRRKLKCRIGDGKGRLVVDTHNGDVLIR
ncbi:MAG: DUF4097 family beta strand repeat-containing protein [Planctomycetota bacterium]